MPDIQDLSAAEAKEGLKSSHKSMMVTGFRLIGSALGHGK